ncbi:retrovirus-related pol polyprotein from transposon TNT 1-94 [Tanacetum coccineum]
MQPVPKISLICLTKTTMFHGHHVFSGDADRKVPVNETLHEQTNDELTEKELKQIEADDQAIQTNLLGLPEDIYVAVDSCETSQEIWLRVQQMMKGFDIGIQEKKAKLFTKWERFTSIDGESTESNYHRFSKLMNDFKRNKHFPEKIATNYTQLYDFLKYNQKEVDDLRAERLAKTHDPLALMANSNNPFNYPVFHQDQPSSNPITAMNMALILMAKAFKLNYLTPTNNNQIISSNLHNRQIAQPGMNMGQDRHMQMVGGYGGNQFRQYTRLIVVPKIANHNPNGNDNVVAARAEGNAIGNNVNQIRCYICRGLGHLARNCTVRPRRMDVAYLQTQLLIAQKEEAGIQLQVEEFDLMVAAADLDEIEEVNANCILMANLQQASTSGTRIDKAPVYDLDGSAELLKPIPEPHQVQQNDSNVISEVSSVEQDGGTVDQHPVTVEETHAYFESLYNNLAIEVEKLSKEKSTVSSLLEEKKKLKFDFKIREDELLDKQIQLGNNLNELDNILVKTSQSIQTMHMFSPKPDSFYHTEQKMALGYQNPFYLKQAQQKQ